MRCRRLSGAERWPSGHCIRLCHSLIVVVVCLAVWPMDKIGNADAYTLEQVRRADYTTNCGLGFAGLHCDEVMTCEELDYCSGHGICQRGGYCICDTGWQGAACKQSYCPSGCSGHGSCAATGGCVCDAGFTGVICDQVICLGGGIALGMVLACRAAFATARMDISAQPATKSTSHKSVRITVMTCSYNCCMMVVVIAIRMTGAVHVRFPG